MLRPSGVVFCTDALRVLQRHTNDNQRSVVYNAYSHSMLTEKELQDPDLASWEFALKFVLRLSPSHHEPYLQLATGQCGWLVEFNEQFAEMCRFTDSKVVSGYLHGSPKLGYRIVLENRVVFGQVSSGQTVFASGMPAPDLIRHWPSSMDGGVPIPVTELV